MGKARVSEGVLQVLAYPHPLVHLLLTEVGQPHQLLKLLLWTVDQREAHLHHITVEGRTRGWTWRPAAVLEFALKHLNRLPPSQLARQSESTFLAGGSKHCAHRALTSKLNDDMMKQFRVLLILANSEIGHLYKLKVINTPAQSYLSESSKEGGNISQREFAQLGHIDSSALLLQPQVHTGHRLQMLLASEVAGDLGRALQTHIAHRTVHPSAN